MDYTSISAQILSAIAKLAPLSIVIAALALLHNFWQARVKRQRDDAVAVREIFNRLGVKAYLLNWSLIGNSSIAAGVLQIREAIEARVGKKPSAEDLASFASDQMLFEAVVEKAWRDSKVIEKFQSEALDFGKLRADLGNRVPLIQIALQEIDTRLRMLFLLNTFVLFAIRNDAEIKALGKAEPSREADGMARLHRILFSASVIPDKGSFSEACRFLQEFSSAVASAADDAILDLTRRRRSPLQRIQDWLVEQRSRRLENSETSALLRGLKTSAPAEFSLLKRVVEEVAQTKKAAGVRLRVLEQSRKRILKTFKGNPEAGSLGDASQKFLDKYVDKESGSRDLIMTLLRIRAGGVDDPDIDLFLASSSGSTALAESALNRGARVNITLEKILEKYQNVSELEPPR